MHHWPAVSRKYALNPRFWNPAVSWNRPKFLGYKFDAKHLAASLNQATIFGTGVAIMIGERQPICRYLLDFGISGTHYVVGNWVAFDWVF